MDILKVYLDVTGNLGIHISWTVILFVVVVLWILHNHYRFFRMDKEFTIDEVQLGIGTQKIKIKPNYQVRQISYQLWIELSTRKIGLPIDYQHDVIVDIYRSWYEFFKITRELIKTVPSEKIRSDENTRKLVDVAIEVLNECLRPHLTCWQARFIRWYSVESIKDENKQLDPQELQQAYPQYKKLTEEMRAVNSKLIQYREVLDSIVMGK